MMVKKTIQSKSKRKPVKASVSAGSLVDQIKTSPPYADKAGATARLDDLLKDASASSPLRALLKQPATRDLTLSIAGHSPYLWQLISKDTERFARLLSKPPENSLDACQDHLRECLSGYDVDEMAMQALRLMKQEAHLLIALADIAGIWEVDQVVEAITSMADTAVSEALNYLLRQAAASGKLILANKDNPGQDSGLTVLALGKHGARELNYSSDIDLIVFYDPASKIVSEEGAAGQIFVRITRQLVRLLQELTGDGYVLRVDLRLRPDPGSTAVAVSLPAAFSYYESVGQNWERAAFIKARPVAGDIDLGLAFVDDLAPFIWRRYFDYAAIADVHAMKRQIHAVRGHGRIAIAGHDIKLGRGGIREVEFFVQTQQLIFGGRRPKLRGSQTLPMLRALEADGWITPDAVEQLSASYRTLRKVEHRLQMVIDEQTQRLPGSAKELETFANFCGFQNVADFESCLTSEMRNVERHYARLFEHAPGLSSEIGSLVFAGSSDDPETLLTLQNLGFSDPPRAIETIRGWFFGRRAAIQSARAREVLTELVPGLIDSFSGSGDPDAALAAFDEALGHMPASVELLSILKSNAAVRELFGDILGGAPHMAHVITQRPHVLDAAIDPSYLDQARDDAYFHERAARTNPLRLDTEVVLDGMRDMALEESFLIGVRMLSGSIESRAAGMQFSSLATALVDVALKHIEHVFQQDYGRVPKGKCVILGLGKLGSREMTATSDLDLILLYDFDEENPESDGRRSLHANQYYARLTQRLVSALTVPTRRGPLYEVDMRLRPSGRQGPVATSIQSFHDYQLREAETWEHMALSRARVIAGSEELGASANAIIETVMQQTRDKKALQSAILDMRQLIADSKGDSNQWDLKLMSGGLVDIEFAAQYLSLAYANSKHSIWDANTHDVLKNALSAKVIAPDVGSLLVEAHTYYSAIMHTLRLAIDGDFDPATTPAGVLRRIAGAVNLPDFKTVESQLQTYREQVRAAFLDLLQQ